MYVFGVLPFFACHGVVLMVSTEDYSTAQADQEVCLFLATVCRSAFFFPCTHPNRCHCKMLNLPFRSLKEEALKDVLEDSDSEVDDSTAHTSDTKGNPGTAKPTTTSIPIQEPKKNIPTPTPAEMASAAWTTYSDEGSQNNSLGQCFVNILPPDLLLQCAEFLGDVATLCRVREVNMAWLGTLDGREAGRRLWRPVFYRLRANGSIHAATDSKGQQRRQLKVYDLGTPTSASNAVRCPASGGSGGGVQMLTPSPATRRSSSLVRSGSKDQASLERGSTPGSEAGTVSGSPSLRRSSACLVCGLIQRVGFRGRDCEMCASSLMVLPGGPATPRVAYTRVNLSGSAGENAVSTSSGAVPFPARPTPGAVVGSASEVFAGCVGAGGSATNVLVAGVTAGPRGGGNGDGEDVGEDDDVDDVDWHFLVKRLAEEKRIASGWGSLRHGWVWLQTALQVRLGCVGQISQCSYPTYRWTALSGSGVRYLYSYVFRL